jgi:hypothetical protein
MGRGIVKALFVFLWMGFMAAQAATGFMHQLFEGGFYPRAMRPIAWIVDTLFTGPFGHTGGAIALLVLGLLFAVLIVRQEYYGESLLESLRR